MKQWCEEQDDEMFSSGWKYDGQNKAGTRGIKAKTALALHGCSKKSTSNVELG